MSERIKRVFLLLGLLALAYVVLNHFASLSLGSITLTLSKSTVAPGDTFSATVEVDYIGESFDYICFGGISPYNYCSASGGTGACYDPCQPIDFSTEDPLNTYWYLGHKFFYNDPILGTSYADSQGLHYSVGKYQEESRGVDILLVESKNPSRFDGFFLPDGGVLKIEGTLKTGSLNSFLALGGGVIGVCYLSDRSAPSISIYDGSWSYYRTVSGSWYGHNWTCKLYYHAENDISEPFGIRVTAYDDQDVYFTFASRCFYDSSYCPVTISDEMYVYIGDLSMRMSDPGIYHFELDLPTGFSTSNDCVDVYNDTYTWSVSVSSSASAGTKAITAYASAQGYIYLFLSPDYRSAWYTSCGFTSSSDPIFIDSDTEYVTVQTPASSVTLYAYGQNSGSPSQEPDDHYMRGRIYVSGGTLFDKVDLYVDGSLVASYSKSSFSCGSSYCYKDFSLNFSGKSDGSHSLQAKLYVNGSLKDTDTKTVYYYQVGVRNVVASQAGNDNVSVSFEYKGGHSAYLIYLDTSSCVVAQNTNFRPSSAHNWQTFGPQSFPIPDCARTPGTHTLYVKLSDESGLSDTDSTTVNFSFTYSYSVSLDQPTAGTKHLATDRRGAPPSDYSEPYSISYSTDDPSATLKLLVNGSQVQSWTVTGSGTKSGTVSSNYLQCGDTEFKATLSGSSGSDQSSAVVHYVCWYSSIESPKGTVDVPSRDNVTVNPDVTLTLLGVTDETPQDLPKVVNAYLDGTPLSPVSCPAGYTDCFAVPVGGMTCGSTHTLSLEVGDGATVYATDTESITLNCVQRYVDIVSPSDGAEYDFNVPLSEVNLDVYVNYAGGVSLSFKLNGSSIELIENNDGCSYSACYVLPGTELRVGDNNLEVSLLDEGENVLATDSVTFRVNLWQFLVGEDWDVTPAILYVEEHGSHPDACTVLYEGNAENMVYDSDDKRWLLPIDESYADKNVEILCAYEARIVYDVNYTIQGPGVQPASPVPRVGGGGGGTVTVTRTVAFPVFPERRTAANYIYSVYHFAGVEPSRNLKDVYVAQGKLCIVPRSGERVEVIYYRYNFGAFPEDDTAARQIIAHLTPDLAQNVSQSQQGGAFCFQIPGTGVFDLRFDDGEYYVLVLDVSEAAGGLNISVIAVGLIVLVLIIYMLMQGGGLGL